MYTLPCICNDISRARPNSLPSTTHCSLTTMLRVRTATRCPCRSTTVRRVAARPVTAQRDVRVRAAFDERPKEPITPEQNQISEELMKSMEKNIGEALEVDSVSVTDVYGDHQHVCISVVSTQFDGLTAVKRQRLVYQVCCLHVLPLSGCRILEMQNLLDSIQEL